MANENARVYVGNLPYSSTDEDFKEHLQGLGLAPTDTKVIMDRETGRARGFAFATFGTDAAAAEAIEVISGSVLDNRTLSASVANPRPERSGGGGGGGGWHDRREEDRHGRGGRDNRERRGRR